MSDNNTTPEAEQPDHELPEIGSAEFARATPADRYRARQRSAALVEAIREERAERRSKW